MSVKGIEIKGCNVSYDGDIAVFHKTSVKISGKIKEGKCSDVHEVSYELSFNDVPVCEILAHAARSLRIDIAKVRDKGDDAVRALNGSVVDYADISSLTANSLSTPEKVENAFEKLSPEVQKAMLEKLLAKMK